MQLKQQKYFTTQLLIWNSKNNDRQMPWKGEKDPYKIWLSEIILQQTRVAQGLQYYNRFIQKFPTVQSLANAPETSVFKLWEGLGYYTRCKNLIATAKYIATELHGIFPTKYVDILALKGIGPYTAAAIGSFAFDLPYAVLDGNVFRVLARYFNISTPINSTEGKKVFNLLAQNLLDKKSPGIYNQALMDFGATVCKPQMPLCLHCMLQSKCGAYLDKTVNVLPLKNKPPIKKTRWFYYLIISVNKKLYIQKRGGDDIWENLFQFVLIEKEKPITIKNLHLLSEITRLGKIVHISSEKKQTLTHQIIKGRFIHINTMKSISIKGYHQVTINDIKKLPFPKFITTYFKDKNVSLNL